MNNASIVAGAQFITNARGVFNCPSGAAIAWGWPPRHSCDPMYSEATILIRTLTSSALASSLMLCTNVALAADKDQTRDQSQIRDEDPIYGNQLMTQQERMEHRNRMRSLKTYKEREAYRLEQYKKMQERAKAKGVTLPDEPPARGMMMGPGGG